MTNIAEDNLDREPTHCFGGDKFGRVPPEVGYRVADFTFEESWAAPPRFLKAA